MNRSYNQKDFESNRRESMNSSFDTRKEVALRIFSIEEDKKFQSPNNKVESSTLYIEEECIEIGRINFMTQKENEIAFCMRDRRNSIKKTLKFKSISEAQKCYTRIRAIKSMRQGVSEKKKGFDTRSSSSTVVTVRVFDDEI